MSQNLISGSLNAEDQKSINDALDAINSKLPFLSAMQNMDVSKFFKPGNSYQPLLNLAVRAMYAWQADEYVGNYSLQTSPFYIIIY